MFFILGSLTIGGLGLWLILTSFHENLIFFYGPTELISANPSPTKRVRIGGLVQEKSLELSAEMTSFKITDGETIVTIQYTGILPDLFREGQGIIAQGTYRGDHTFYAEEILAKHDESYMPKEVADTLKEKGLWQGDRP